jgi:hypothetical protein
MQISENEIYLLIKYIKSVLWRVAKCLSYIEEARCLKFKDTFQSVRGSICDDGNVDEEECGSGIANHKRLRHLPNVQILLNSVTRFQCPFNAGTRVGLFPVATH